MKYRLDKINDEAQDLCKEIKGDLDTAGKHLEQIAEEQHRVTELSWQAARIVDQTDIDFKVKTKLNNRDIAFLFLALALQCARQYLLPNDKLRLTAVQGDALVEGTVGKLVPPSIDEILFQSVPYDAITTGPHVSETGLSGVTHRYRTLGHDPVLGWIFGTANIMTSSLTKYDLESYQVKNMMMIRHYPLGAPGIIKDAATYAQTDPSLLAAAVARQAIHFGSDYFTKQGLPVPVIATVNNDLAKAMVTKGHIDMWSISRGATIAVLINNLVACIHQLFYDEKKDGALTLYEVKTRKILSYSNAMATTSNIVVSAFTENPDLLDVGGLLVTIHQLVSDYKFIHEIKKDFLKNQLYDHIVGSEYDFMKGDF